MYLEIRTGPSSAHLTQESNLDTTFHSRQSSGEKMRILVVEDDAMQRLVLVSLLRTHGHEVVAVSDGNAAWEELSRKPFNIVFTDWMMPGMSGLELIRKIRMTGSGRYVYVILCTSRSSRADLVEGLKSGADDYIGKPIHEDELLVRLAAGERVIDLERRLEEENRKLEESNQSLKSAYETIRADLDAAARMQRSLLPPAGTIHGIQCNSLFLPASVVAGDVFNFFSIGLNSVGFYLLDVSGHGIPAAMLSVTLSKVLTTRPEASSPLVAPTQSGSAYDIRPPHEALSEMNDRFQDQDDMYFTMVYGVLDKDSGCLRLAQAGHPAPILLRRNGPPEPLGDGGFPLGMLPDRSFDALEYHVEKGDRLFLCSDGILECTNSAGEEFGQHRLMEVLNKHRQSSLETLLHSLQSTMHQWAGSTEFADDVTLLALELGSLLEETPTENAEKAGGLL
jgi:sigma-B regulation protein RsbU (phosphoserine phosphatase)